MAGSEVYDLVSAMQAGDRLAEAERRYEIIAEMLDPRRELGEDERPITGTEVKALSIEADRLMEKIVAIRAQRDPKPVPGEGEGGTVVSMDAARAKAAIGL